MVKQIDRRRTRQAIHARIRRKVSGTAERPRLAFYKSARHVYAQVIDDMSGATLLSASSVAKSTQGTVPRSGNMEAAKALGETIAKLASEKNIDNVVFDRGGFLFHGAVRAFAQAARDNGLKF